MYFVKASSITTEFLLGIELKPFYSDARTSLIISITILTKKERLTLTKLNP